MCQGLGPSKHDETSEIDCTTVVCFHVMCRYETYTYVSVLLGWGGRGVMYSFLECCV